MYIQLLQNLEFPGKEKLLPLMEKEPNVSPLLIAAATRLWESIPSLLKISDIVKTINEKNKFGLTTLHIAALHGKADAVQLLREAGDTTTDQALVDLRGFRGETLLMGSVIYGLIEGVRYLLSIPQIKATINEKNEFGLTALHIAAFHGKAGVVQLLREAGDATTDQALADCRSNNSEDMTLLMVAVGNGLIEGVRYLLSIPQIKATINEKNKFGLTPLHIAALSGKADVIQLLREAGDTTTDQALADWRNSGGETLLMVAARNGGIEGVRYLLNNPAVKNTINLSVPGSNYRIIPGIAAGSALKHACFSNNPANKIEIIKLLLASGADAKLVNLNLLSLRNLNLPEQYEVVELIKAAQQQQATRPSQPQVLLLPQNVPPVPMSNNSLPRSTHLQQIQQSLSHMANESQQMALALERSQRESRNKDLLLQKNQQALNALCLEYSRQSAKIERLTAELTQLKSAVVVVPPQQAQNATMEAVVSTTSTSQIKKKRKTTATTVTTTTSSISSSGKKPESVSISKGGVGEEPLQKKSRIAVNEEPAPALLTMFESVVGTHDYPLSVDEMDPIDFTNNTGVGPQPKIKIE